MILDKLMTDAIRNHKTTSALIVEALRKAILHGELKAGQVLRQEELAEAFGVSRIPVREAFHQLEAEGLISIYPHKGAVVTTLSAAEGQELYEIRVALETTALRLAVPNLEASHLAQAEKILRAADNETEVTHWGELNWEFHAALYSAAHRPLLLSMLKNLHDRVDRYMRFELAALDYRARSQAEHYHILAACWQGDVNQAGQLLTAHVEEAGKLLVAFLKQAEQ